MFTQNGCQPRLGPIEAGGTHLSVLKSLGQFFMTLGLNNALSGVDQALWDIKGKIAAMPAYDLFGGKARDAAAAYVHASGNEPQAVEEMVRVFMEGGFHYIRVQVATPGFSGYGTGIGATEADLL